MQLIKSIFTKLFRSKTKVNPAYNVIKQELPEIEQWSEDRILDQLSLVSEMQYILKLADKHKWTRIFGNANPLMLSFRKEDMRINIYPTTMTVSTALDHPRKGKTQLHRRNVSMSVLNTLFIDPRAHTNKGYYAVK